MIIFLIKNVSKMYFGPIDSVSNFYVWIGIFYKSRKSVSKFSLLLHCVEQNTVTWIDKVESLLDEIQV